jgi:hypothetical protein
MTHPNGHSIKILQALILYFISTILQYSYTFLFSVFFFSCDPKEPYKYVARRGSSAPLQRNPRANESNKLGLV